LPGSALTISTGLLTYLPGLIIEVAEGVVSLKSKDYGKGTRLIVGPNGELLPTSSMPPRSFAETDSTPLQVRLLDFGKATASYPTELKGKALSCALFEFSAKKAGDIIVLEASSAQAESFQGDKVSAVMSLIAGGDTEAVSSEAFTAGATIVGTDLSLG